MDIQPTIIVIVIAFCTAYFSLEISPEHHLENAKNILKSIDENSCVEKYCQAFEDDQTHENFVTIFKDLDEILQDLSHETLRERFHNKNKNSTDALFHFLLSDPTPQQIQEFINRRLSEKNSSPTGHKIVKRGVGQTILNAVNWVIEKISNIDWGTVVKRAGQIFSVVQAVRSVTDPSQMALNAGFAVTKAVVIEATEDKLSEWWEGKNK